MKAEREKPLGLDMGFDEALARFIGTAPAELAGNIAAAKDKRGPPERSPPPAEGPDQPLD